MIIFGVIIKLKRPVAQIPQCTSPISHNAPFYSRNVHMCAHSVPNGTLWDICLMHCGICTRSLRPPGTHVSLSFFFFQNSKIFIQENAYIGNVMQKMSVILCRLQCFNSSVSNFSYYTHVFASNLTLSFQFFLCVHDLFERCLYIFSFDLIIMFL